MAQRAPGRHYRQGLTLVEFLRTFPDDAAAERWFVEQRWPDGVHCPKCGSFDVIERKSRRPQPYRCRDCRAYFSVKTGTVMQSSNLGLQTWALAGYLLMTDLKGQSSMKLHRDLGVTYKTAWHLAHRVRETWERETGGGLFTGAVEADETYVGGRKKSGLPGRGPIGKEIVAGVKDRESKRVVAKVVENVKKDTLHGFVRSTTDTGSATVYTDELRSYRGVAERHETVVHSTGEYVRDQAHTNGIESFWSTFKRGLNGTYHKVSPKHLGRYVTEFAGRHNDRDKDTMDQMTSMARGMVGKRLRYADLIADNGLPSGARRVSDKICYVIIPS